MRKGGEKVETDNPADHYNTVLKMAKKRALVDAVLTTTAAATSSRRTWTTSPITSLPRRLPLIAPGAVPRSLPTSVSSPAPTSLSASRSPFRSEPADFRATEVHFGKNRGLKLADLSPQQIHWYEKEWLPKKEGQSKFSDADLALIRGLRAYRVWRESEKAQAAVGHPVEAMA